MNVTFNSSFFLIPYHLPWQNKSKQHLQIPTQHICKMILNVFVFYMAQYYVNNCPLKWVFTRLFPWLLMRKLSPYILIWKYLWVIAAAAAVVHALKTASLRLHIVSKGVLCFAFLQKPQLRICLLSLNLDLSSSRARGAQAQWEHCTPHKAASLAMLRNPFPPSSRIPVCFPVTPQCSQCSDQSWWKGALNEVWIFLQGFSEQ